MMTMHSAKGLEFDNVYIVGAEEGIFPGLRSIGEPDEMEEERRLCYVALTRARKSLTLICARQRMLFGNTSSHNPSRFIDEIPEQFIERCESQRNDVFGTGGARAEYGAYSAGYKKPYTPEKPKYSYSAPPAAAAQKQGESFKAGDEIVHAAFGGGVIAKMTPMGGDSLVEIEFENGTKRLMLKAAATHMHKK